MLPEDKDNGQDGGEDEQQVPPAAGGEGDQQEDPEGEDHDNEEEEDELSPEEFAFLDRQLDQLNSALDNLEQRNDRLHGELRELLESSREARQIIHQEGLDKGGKEQQPSKNKDDNSEKPMDQG